MPSSINAGFLFLVTTLFDMYLFILAVRFVLVYAGANYFDPITQFVVKITDFIIKPLRKIIPNVNRLEIATLVLIVVLEMVKFFLLSLVSSGMPAILGLLMLATADTFKLFIQFFFYAILLQVLMSWIQPQSPMMHTLYLVTSPVMRPVQRLIPPVGGMDISPIPAMIGLQLLLIILVDPLMMMGMRMALGG